jgi:hypothetical protein
VESARAGQLGRTAGRGVEHQHAAVVEVVGIAGRRF